MRLLTLAAAALAALLLTIALANAQEPPESQTATQLEPGINLVGWTGEPTSTSQLFREIPQLESIWAWDAELNDWIVAGRNAPEWLGGLGRVRAGMGLRLILGGEEPFLWQRSTEPTHGLVELRTGWNLVAWSGADGAPLEQVAKGIGWSLRELRRWHAANQQWTTWTSPERSAQLIAASAANQGATDEEAEPVTVRRGEALWVNVARSVNWLQPTGILPRLVFPGGASDELQARVREDLESVLAFYGQQYGIQADPTDLTVYVAKDVEALIQALKDGGHEASTLARARRVWDSGDAHAGYSWRGTNSRIVLEQPTLNQVPEWLGPHLAHEYAHIVQRQLQARYHQGLPRWLLEGAASWTQFEYDAGGELALQELLEQDRSLLTPATPILRSTESENDGKWEYALGRLAIGLLDTKPGAGSWLEFWRQLAPTEIRPDSKGKTQLHWTTTFQEVFGFSIPGFYAEFDAWQRKQTSEGMYIEGEITLVGGRPLAPRPIIWATCRPDHCNTHASSRTKTNQEGKFAIRVPTDGKYYIRIDWENCTMFVRDSTITTNFSARSLVRVEGAGVRLPSLQIPAGLCAHRISGRVLDVSGMPLAFAQIKVASGSGSKATDDMGRFEIRVPSDGVYSFQLGIDACRFSLDGQTLGSPNNPIRVSGADVTGITLRLPGTTEELCG